MAKRRILIIDDLAIYREPISLALQSQGYRTETAANGKEALHIVETNIRPFDLLIVDYSMPELNGLEFLRRASAYPQMHGVPSIMLTDMADKEIVVGARKLGVRDYILKSSFSLTLLLEKVKEHISAAVVEREQSLAPPADKPASEVTAANPGEGVLHKIKKYIGANPIPQAIQEILSLTESTDTEGAELVRAIKADPLLATRVLKIANSTTYNRTNRKVSTIEDAVGKIGFLTIRDIATNAFFCVAPTTNAQNWQARLSFHSFSVGNLMSHFCKGSELTQSAHLTGLCHDLPELIVGQLFPAEYKAALESCQEDPVRFRKEISQRLGVPYIEIAEQVVNELGLPNETSEAILCHLGSRNSSLPLASALNFAHSFANSMGYFIRSDSTFSVFANERIQEIFKAEREQLKVPVHFEKEIVDSLQPLGFSTQSLPKQERLKIKVLYLHSAGVAGEDPLKTWLERNCYLLTSNEENPTISSHIAECLIVSTLRPASEIEAEPQLREAVTQAKQHGIPTIFCAPEALNPEPEVTESNKLHCRMLTFSDRAMRALLQKFLPKS